MMTKIKTLSTVVVFSIFLLASCSQKTTNTSNRNNAQTEFGDRPPRPDNAEMGQRGDRPDPKEMFSKTDANGDGYVSESEARGPLKDHFSEMDTNGDSKISEEEFNTAMQKHRGERPPRPNAE